MREYPTDEELEFFIQQMEQQELYAPKHMKEQILEKAFPGQTVEVLPKSGSGTGAVRLFTYRLKIAAGMAAALVMLMLLPGILGNGRYGEDRSWEERADQRVKEWEMEEQNKVDVNYVLNEGMRRADQKINLWIGKVDNLSFGNLLKTDNGGNSNEN
ncbi:MAG: hypothetical protein HFI43_14895 [Lachnospiraceae bacterium]|jgi:hypothetical protein|nr:hypothetical protein [Lachnospiraceae bacterium]GFI17650.1 hypothetical protein IMSAGC009_02822 [Lachnospiraceae bacterium]